MSLFKKMQSRQIQKKANSFIKSLSNKSEKEIEQMYLDRKEFENNEIVLSYLFFKHPSLIRILPLDFQVSRINSNLSKFRYGSNEAKKQLVSSWLTDNKFFMNASVVQMTDEEYSMYIRLYFQQPEDVAKLYMDDLRRVIEILSKIDLKATEDIILKIKDDLTDRQWEFVILGCPSMVKFATQNVQNKYSEDETYNLYLNGSARETYVEKKLEKLKEDKSLLKTMPIDVQREYINKNPYMVNYIDNDSLIELLKYDIDLLRFVSFPSLKDNQDVIYGLIENIENKSIKDIINIFINKGLVNAKGKLYRYDSNSEDISYQYTPKLLKIIQKLDINQIISLIMTDVNYSLAYIVPVYNDNDSIEEKEKIIIDCNSRCLYLFKTYYGEEIYDKYYKVINKIFNEYLTNISKYDYSKDYNALFDLFKILFNKNIITKNNVEKVTIFIGMSLLYKNSTKESTNKPTIKLLNDIINTAYDINITIDKDIYDFLSLEIFDDRLSFINKEILEDYFKYNFVHISSLLFIAKAKKVNELFKKYYYIMISIFGDNKETLFKSVENFHYYIDILKDIEDKQLSDDEEKNFIDLIASFNNNYAITQKSELSNYDMTLLKKLVGELSTVTDSEVVNNLLCKYLFNKGYNQKGNTGLLETDTIEDICNSFDTDTLLDFKYNNESVFSKEEIDLIAMINILFTTKDVDLLLSYIESLMNNKIKRNIISIINIFNKLKKYKVDIINDSIVTLNEIELLSAQRSDLIKKSINNGVEIYTVFNQDFKVLCSLQNDGIYYLYTNISELEKNYYGYSKLIKNSSIRFTNKDSRTYIKVNKDNKTKTKLKPEFIIVVGKLTDSIINIAKKNNLKVVEVKGDNLW
ncbi:MAG: hypothetical protein PUA90_04225 [bacterium]|nr:hypothetical protein [bacterium]